MSEAISYVFVWHTVRDDRVCLKCEALDGRTWINQDPFRQPTLQDFMYGDIWDFANDRSLMHPNCRCNLEIQINVNLNDLAGYGRAVHTVNVVDC